MINTRDRIVTHNLEKMSFDQVFKPTAGVYFNIICDLNVLKTIYLFFFSRPLFLKLPT